MNGGGAAKRKSIFAWGIRTGDTPAQERSKLTRNPPDILITTPESLYLMLTSRARENATRRRNGNY